MSARLVALGDLRTLPGAAHARRARREGAGLGHWGRRRRASNQGPTPESAADDPTTAADTTQNRPTALRAAPPARAPCGRRKSAVLGCPASSGAPTTGGSTRVDSWAPRVSVGPGPGPGPKSPGPGPEQGNGHGRATEYQPEDPRPRRGFWLILPCTRRAGAGSKTPGPGRCRGHDRDPPQVLEPRQSPGNPGPVNLDGPGDLALALGKPSLTASRPPVRPAGGSGRRPGVGRGHRRSDRDRGCRPRRYAPDGAGLVVVVDDGLGVSARTQGRPQLAHARLLYRTTISSGVRPYA